ncbi:hypothetical protein [Afifella aestuarii]|uniref:hypothetical protein n=1 Tax=Afifella aestuarii TaxID=1909496 RepID=UPI000FE3CA3A|nr:hypothetical protein [Afifella aestuarii]
MTSTPVLLAALLLLSLLVPLYDLPKRAFWWALLSQCILCLLWGALGWGIVAPALWSPSVRCSDLGALFDGSCGFADMANEILATLATMVLLTAVCGFALRTAIKGTHREFIRRFREPGGPMRVVLVFALLGPPIAAMLFVALMLPLPNSAFDITATIAIAIALAYRFAFISMLCSGAVVAVVAGRTGSVWLRAMAAIGPAMLITFLDATYVGSPQSGEHSFVPFLYAGFAAASALLCLALARPALSLGGTATWDESRHS